MPEAVKRVLLVEDDIDLMLPGIDGLEICRRARGLARDTPIIITSALNSEVHRIQGLEMGADDDLAKPFSAARPCPLRKAEACWRSSLTNAACGHRAPRAGRDWVRAAMKRPSVIVAADT